MQDKQLSKNFWLSEFAVSKDYPEEAKKIEFSPLDRAKLFYLCRYILQPVRNHLNTTPIISPKNLEQKIITLSGKRTRPLNTLLHKGVDRFSLHLFMHLFDCAVDFWCTDLWKAFHYIQKGLIYGELIIYLNEEYHPRFIHIALPNEKNYMQTLVDYKGTIHNWEGFTIRET